MMTRLAQGQRNSVLEKRVENALSRHPNLRYRDVACEWQDDVLIIRGSLPTFYLKQLLQTALLQVDGVTRIDNRVDVVSVQP
jgi:hypothetical protein